MSNKPVIAQPSPESRKSGNSEKPATLEELLAEQKRTNELLEALLRQGDRVDGPMRVMGDFGPELEQIRRSTEQGRSRLDILLKLGSRLRRGWNR